MPDLSARERYGAVVMRCPSRGAGYSLRRKPNTARRVTRRGKEPACLVATPQRTPSLPLMWKAALTGSLEFCRHPDAQEGGMEQEEPAGQDTLF